MSDEGRELRECVFSPMLFNSIDWTETALFNRPPSQVSVLLSDDRVFGIHLWNYNTQSVPRDSDTSLIGLLSRQAPLSDIIPGG